MSDFWVSAFRTPHSALRKAAPVTLLHDQLISVRLFGSRARQEGSAESDLDVLVLLKEKDRAVCRRIIEVALDCDLAYGTNLAPTILTAQEYDKNRRHETPFYRNVERDAVSLWPRANRHPQ